MFVRFTGPHSLSLSGAVIEEGQDALIRGGRLGVGVRVRARVGWGDAIGDLPGGGQFRHAGPGPDQFPGRTRQLLAQDGDRLGGRLMLGLEGRLDLAAATLPSARTAKAESKDRTGSALNPAPR